MAIIYLRSTTGSDANDGSTWALAKATLADALTAAGAGGTVYMSQAHAESVAAAISLASPGTVASPVQVICVNDSAEPPTALATTGSVATNGAYTLNHTGTTWMYGVTLKSGLIIRVTGSVLTLVSGVLQLTSTDGGRYIEAAVQNAPTVLVLINTNVVFGAPNQAIQVNNCRLIWRGGNVSGGGGFSLFLGNNYWGANMVDVRGVDLSATSGQLVSSEAVHRSGSFVFENCKLHASYANTTRDSQPYVSSRKLHASDSSDTNYRVEEPSYEGTITQETTIVRTGGASDGTTAMARKLVTTAGAKYVYPLVFEFAAWNDTVGTAKTATVEIVHDSLTALLDNEVWLEAEYMGSTLTPIASYVNDSADVLTTGAAQTASTEAWTTTGLTNPNKQKLSVTFTPQLKGYVKYRVYLAKPSYTVYVDPLVTVT